MSKTNRRPFSWKPALDDDEAAVVIVQKRGDRPTVFQMEGPVDVLASLLEAVNTVKQKRVRRRSRPDG